MSTAMTASLPVIDLTASRAGAPDDATVDDIRRACEDTGFFLVSGHGVSETLIARTYAAIETFFDLPLERKLAVARRADDISRGYDRMGGQTLSNTLGATSPPDLQEVFSFGPPRIDNTPYYREGYGRTHFPPNQWPSEPADFRPAAEAYYAAMTELADHLMRLFARALTLPALFFENKIDRQISSVRFIHYPDQPDAPLPGQLRAGAHSDYGTLTILRVDDAPGGLQLYSRSGDWIDVGFIPGTFVVNIGDLMMQWTNDRWVSTLHRVVNPPRDVATSSRRMSMVFFHQPNYDAEIACLDRDGQLAASPHYPPTTSGAHWRAKNAASRMASITR